MTGAAVPSLIGIIFLLLVGLLAVLAERHSVQARWFALLNLGLAATSGLGYLSTAAPEGFAARALLCGRLANASAGIAFLALYQQLSALASDSSHPSVVRLRRYTRAAAAVSLLVGALAASPLVVAGIRWQPGEGYVPSFGPLLPVVLAGILLVGGWALAFLFAINRHGSARVRREAAWMAVGVLLFDLFGMVMLALVLPRFGMATVAWAPASLAAGSMVMLGALVLTRQRELEERDSDRSWGRRIRESPTGGVAGPSCRACRTCGAMLGPSVQMAHCPLDGGAMVDGADPWPGRTLDERFTIEKLIGSGGMGRVYRARHLRLGTPIAVKLLNADLAADGRTGERFSREARSAMRIRSPHVVIVHDLGELPPGIPFLTMELIEGKSLSELLSDAGRLDARSVALLGLQLAEGLAAAHAEGVVHRDLKPDNILIERDGHHDTAKIVDFGLAKIFGEQLGSGEMTTVGRVFGTPAYISPEQASGRGADAKSDVYALGAILYRARAGKRPFEGSALELLAQHIGTPAPPLGDDPLDRLITSLLAKHPADRPEARALAATFAGFTERSGLLEVVGAGADQPSATGPTIPG